MNRRDFINKVGVGAGIAASLGSSRISTVLGANEKLRIGVIGCGGMSNAHMDALLEMKDSDNCEIVAVCDIYQKRLDAAAAKTGGEPHKNYKDVLARKDVDYVLIATPEHWHHRMCLDALDAGKHVYVEKPMTHTIEQSKEVVKKVKETGLKLQVGVQGMSDESYEVARDYIKKDALGKVVQAQIDYSRNYVGDFWAYDIDLDAKPGVNLDWDAWLGPAPKRPWDPRRFFQWRRYWDYSGGVATDLFIHRVTRILKAADLKFPDYTVGSGGTYNFPNSVAEIPETFNIMADYPGGPTVVLIASMANDTPIRHVIRGHKATLEFTREGFEISPQRATSADVINPATGAAGGEIIKYKKKGAEDVTLHHRNLQQAIRSGEELRCDASLGYYGVVVTMMGVDSFRDRAYLKWNKDTESVERA
ncbi:MAG: Gfo/Idh/MocA family oxidoreductase [Acidobacteriota bacterium]|nr:MAG: Gfo/Idh/MocA family oxidoreductase [Acidobacteriota bacterium]